MARTYALDKIMAEQRREAATVGEQRQGDDLSVYQTGAEKPARKTRAQRQAELAARQRKRN